MDEQQKTLDCGSILIVDDSRTIQLHLKTILSNAGYALHIAGSGEEALYLAKKELPHLILLDVILPDMSGYDVCQKLKDAEITCDIPIVFVTSYNDMEERIRGLQLGALDYISKPIEKKILLTKAKTFVQLCGDARKIKKMHKHLLHSHTELKQFSQALDNASDSVVLTDCDGNITYCNNAFRQLADIVPLGTFEITIQNYFSDPALVNRSIISALEGTPSGMEIVLKTTSETEVPVQYTSSAILDQDGNPLGLLFMITDQTERKNAEREQAKLEAELLHAQKLESVGQLAAGIAHEINTPIQFISDNIRFLQDSVQDLMELQDKQKVLLATAKESGVDSAVTDAVEQAAEAADVDYLQEELPRAINQSLEGVSRVSSIVRAMKEFAHPGKTEMAPANLNDAIQTTITVARNKWKYVASLETEFDNALPLVPCLVGEFNQVVLNLIVNASDAISDVIGDSGDLGIITITTRQIDDCVEVRVQDTGGGIPEKIRNRIYDPFFTTKEIGRGSGQGLAIAHDVIINKHQGEFFFETEDGIGTTFIIKLPLDEAA